MAFWRRTRDKDVGDAAIAQAVVDRLTHVLGTAPGVYREILPDVLGLDLLLFAPTGTRDFWVVSTLGCSFRDMTVPQDMRDAALWRRAEFLITLPRDWPGLSVTDGIVGDDAHFHAMRLLKRVARYPHAHAAMLGPVTTLDLPEPITGDSPMQSAIVTWPIFARTDDDAGVEVQGLSVNFYQVSPIHQSERAISDRSGTGALMDLLTAAGALRVFDTARAPLTEEPA